ncbi:MAG TPA: glucoamylase family protein [Caulobacter sp.]|nr:glucoamylase family protein [Caulobacter sp.]
MTDEELVAQIQARTFAGLAAATSRGSGLTADRWPTPSACSIAAVGFALSCWTVGVSRGWMSRAHGVALTARALRTLVEAPQGDAAEGVSGTRGWFYHFLNMDTGLRAGTCELSTIDTALLLAGALTSARFFDAEAADEADIRQLAATMLARVDWAFALRPSGRFALGWTPEAGFIPYEWVGYNEAMILYILGLGVEGSPVPEAAWAAWCEGYDRSWRETPAPHLGFGPMFGHQYSHLWIDFRGIQDAFMRGRGLDYFENSRRAVAAQQAYARDNPGRWNGYGEDVWGLTACDGPGEFRRIMGLSIRRFRAYAARGAHDFDDGTLAPTAVAASLPFAPEAATAALRRMIEDHGAAIYGPHGFQDAFNPSVARAPPDHGDIRPMTGWVGRDMLGIDQGPIVAMIENHRSGLIWRLMRQEPVIRRGLLRAGFEGGWLAGG